MAMKVIPSSSLQEYIALLNTNLDYAIREDEIINEMLEEGKKINDAPSFLKFDLLEPTVFLKDEYALSLGKIDAKRGNIHLFNRLYPAKVPFVYDEIQIDMNGLEKTPLGYFNDDYYALALLKDDRIWMSVTPHEINTMKDPVAKAKGQVLTLGLGLGYYAFHLLRKEEVTSLTIIENDPEIISLFKEKLLPRFSHVKKLQIIEEDAFKALKEKHYSFDYLFADLWHFPNDGLPMYIRLLKLEKLYLNAIFSYWIEDSMLALIRRALVILLNETIHEQNANSYLEVSSMSDELINELYFLTQDTKIESKEDVVSLLSKENLKHLAYFLDADKLETAFLEETTFQD